MVAATTRSTVDRRGRDLVANESRGRGIPLCHGITMPTSWRQVIHAGHAARLRCSQRCSRPRRQQAIGGTPTRGDAARSVPGDGDVFVGEEHPLMDVLAFGPPQGGRPVKASVDRGMPVSARGAGVGHWQGTPPDPAMCRCSLQRVCPAARVASHRRVSANSMPGCRWSSIRGVASTTRLAWRGVRSALRE